MRMKLLRGLHNLPANPTPCVATIGNFDGLHLGHQAILTQVRELAQKAQITSMAISFEPTPTEFFSAKNHSPSTGRIYPFRDKIARFKSTAIDMLTCLPFNEHLANMEAEYFVTEILIRQLNIRHLVIGDDFRFGKNREGNFALLQQIGSHYGMKVDKTDTFLHHFENQQEQRISSTWIRNCLQQGDINAANQLLGHSYQLQGRVRHGDKRGRTIGFPTANLCFREQLAAAFGVYAVRIKGLDQEHYYGVANLGQRPTFNGKDTRLETYIFEFDEIIYGKHISVELVTFLRPEQRFGDIQQLTQQIKIDKQQAEESFTKTV